MICCKIMANYGNPAGDFGKLLASLGKCGDILYENDAIFFGDTENLGTDEKKIRQIFKKSGYKDLFILVYTKENPPKESDGLNGWITDKLMKINYKQYEIQSQEVFRNTSKGLDILENEIDDMIRNRQRKEEGNDVRQ